MNNPCGEIPLPFRVDVMNKNQIQSFVEAVAALTGKSDMDVAKSAAVDQYVRRHNYAAKQERFDNGNLPSGSPVYVYCEHCGILLERLPEDYLFPPLRECSQCIGLKKHGWLKEAKDAV